MTTSLYRISNDVDPDIPNSLPVSGVMKGVDTSGLLTPKTLTLESALVVVGNSATPKKAALNSSVYLVSNTTTGFAPKVSTIADGVYIVDVAGAYTDAQIQAILSRALYNAGANGSFGGAGGPVQVDASATTSVTPTATTGAAAELTPLAAV